MKSTGMIRKVDELGRVVIPKEIRKTLGIEERDQIEIFVDGHSIILKKVESSCIFCEKKDTELINYKDKLICTDCVNNLLSSK